MTARRARKDFQDGMKTLGGMLDKMAEEHLDPNRKSDRSKLSLVLGLVPHIVIFVLATSVVWLAKPSSSLFSWHPTLMSLAYAVLMSEAILFFSPWSSPITQMGARSYKVQWHWILQGCALVSSLTGLIIITTNKIINSSPHYTSYHSVFGIFLSGFVFIQTSGGIALMYPEILPFKIRLITMKRMHAFSGTLTYFGGLTTLTLGLFSSWFVANADPILWKVCFACPIVLAGSVLLQVFRSYVWRW